MAGFALDTISELMATKTKEVSTVDDDQRKIIAINRVVTTIENSFTEITTPLQAIEEQLSALKAAEEEAIKRLKTFLKTRPKLTQKLSPHVQCPFSSQRRTQPGRSAVFFPRRGRGGSTRKRHSRYA